MIDFTKIIAGEAGQRETFEELVCQIARRNPPATALEFRRVRYIGLLWLEGVKPKLRN